MGQAGNPRYELRAYEDTDAYRAASILQDLVDSTGSSAVSRDDVANRWAERYPRHAAQTGSKAIRRRMSGALDLLRVAGIVRYHATTVTVINPGLLEMSAGNLEILEDRQGVAVRPGRWTRRPAAPDHLLAVQEPLEQRRQAGQRQEG